MKNNPSNSRYCHQIFCSMKISTSIALIIFHCSPALPILLLILLVLISIHWQYFLLSPFGLEVLLSFFSPIPVVVVFQLPVEQPKTRQKINLSWVFSILWMVLFSLNGYIYVNINQENIIFKSLITSLSSIIFLRKASCSLSISSFCRLAFSSSSCLLRSACSLMNKIYSKIQKYD